MSEQNEKESTNGDELKWAAYNAKMVALFRERDKHPLGSPERESVTQRIRDLWVLEGD